MLTHPRLSVKKIPGKTVNNQKAVYEVAGEVIMGERSHGMEKLRTGMVGCGKVGHTHARALAALEESDFRGVSDISADRAMGFAEEYRVAGYTDPVEMCEKENLQAVVVCTPHPYHLDPAIQAMERGAHVIVEKPLASDLASCDRMIETADAAGVKLGMMSQRMWYPPVRRIKNAIDAGKLGKPVLGTVHMYGWRDEAYYASDPWRGTWDKEGGGVLVNQAPHQLDILQWFMGPVEELFGYWGNLNHPYIEVEDTAVAVIRFRSGALGQILVSNSQDPPLFGNVWVHGDNGATVGVQTDGGAMFVAGMSKIEEPPLNDRWTVKGEEGLLEKWREEDTKAFHAVDATEHYHYLQVGDFIRDVLAGKDPEVTGRDGRGTVEIFTAIYRSQRDGKPVRFPLSPETGRNDYDGRLPNKRSR